MKCSLCQGHYREKSVVISFHREGRTVLVEDVPALVCDLCGDELLTEDTAEQVERLLEREPQATAPLYRFPKKAARTA